MGDIVHIERMGLAGTIFVALAALMVIALTVALVFHVELRKEHRVRRTSGHDTTYGKDLPVSEPAANADIHNGGGPASGDD